jgi:hypothetical protein
MTGCYKCGCFLCTLTEDNMIDTSCGTQCYQCGQRWCNKCFKDGDNQPVFDCCKEHIELFGTSGTESPRRMMRLREKRRERLQQEKKKKEQKEKK